MSDAGGAAVVAGGFGVVGVGDLGEVVAGDARAGEPLLFYRGGFGRYSP